VALFSEIGSTANNVSGVACVLVAAAVVVCDSKEDKAMLPKKRPVNKNSFIFIVVML
jgi:hypothetical protein